MEGIKVFDLNDCDWVAAKNIYEALKYMVEEMDSDPDELDFTEFREVQPHWKLVEDLEVPKEERKTVTVGEVVKRIEKFPTIIASSEY